MMQRPFALPVALPRGPEHYWKVMQSLNKKGFTIRDISMCSDGVAHATVKTYVLFLLREKILARIGTRKDGFAIASVFKIKAPQRQTPTQHRADYAGKRGAIQLSLWNAMRALPQFTLPELAATASTEEHPVKVRTAEEYVRRLMRAGVTEAVVPYARGAKGAVGGKAGVYRLARSANSGPLPPKIFNAAIVFDPNKNRLLGEAVVTEPRS